LAAGGSANGGCVIDIGENWVKQTARNRCEIMTSGGVAALTVPVHGGSGGGRGGDPAKIQTKNVRIDNAKRWQHTHWRSITSAYRNSPFFDHYEDRFAPVYERRFEFLIDLDFELLAIVTSSLKLSGDTGVSTEWVAPAPGDIDLRGKKALRRGDEPSSPPYVQVFSERVAFAPGLSVIDILFNEGPAARDFIAPWTR
jgi:hypothetical protein